MKQRVFVLVSETPYRSFIISVSRHVYRQSSHLLNTFKPYPVYRYK